jgi:cell wall-associated NlpC family hydrolase
MPALLRARPRATSPVLRPAVGLATALVAVLLASMLTAPAASATTRTRMIGHGFSVASDQRGDPYAYGADGPNRFDCSGLVYFSYRKAGFRHIPRSSSAQAGHMRRIHRSHMRRGDFVFVYSGSARPSNVYHVGIFVGFSHGHRIILHAPRSGERVKRERIWTNHWFAGTLRGL